MFNPGRTALLTCSLAIAAVGAIAFAGPTATAASASQKGVCRVDHATARPAVTVPGTWNEVSTFNPPTRRILTNTLNGVFLREPDLLRHRRLVVQR